MKKGSLLGTLARRDKKAITVPNPRARLRQNAGVSKPKPPIYFHIRHWSTREKHAARNSDITKHRIEIRFLDLQNRYALFDVDKVKHTN